MLEKLSYEALKHGGIRRTAEDMREDDPILAIRGRYLVSIVAVELCYLQWSLAKGCPTCPSEPNRFITSRFISIYRVIRLKIRKILQITFPQIGILLPSTLPRGLFGPTFGDEGSSVAGGCNPGLELIPEEDSHLIEVETGLLR